MLSDAISHRWRTSFGEVAPLGHLCRIALADRWLRIHSLPSSKRYAESASEYAELLSRQNTVATCLLGEGANCILFVCDFPDEPAASTLELVSARTPTPTWLPDLAGLAEGYEHLRIAAIEVIWQPTKFDELLRSRADDKVGPLLFANFGAGTAFAPYDGGADLFFESPEGVLKARQNWSAWLSHRSDGL